MERGNIGYRMEGFRKSQKAAEYGGTKPEMLRLSLDIGGNKV